MSATETQTEKKVFRAPRKIALAYLTPNNIGTIRKLNSVTLPVGYSDKFYKEILSPELEDYCQAVLYNDLYVGSLTAKFEDPSAASTRLYIATLSILAPYRNQGLATKLLSNLLDRASASQIGGAPSPWAHLPVSTKSLSKEKKAKLAKPAPIKKVTGVYLHVHTANTEAREWWEKKGFTVKETVENYYAKIEPKSAFLMEKDIVAPSS